MASKIESFSPLVADAQPYRRSGKTLKERLQLVPCDIASAPMPLLSALDLHIYDRPVRIRPIPLGRAGRAFSTPDLVTDATRVSENLIIDARGRRFELSEVRGRGSFGVVRRVDLRDDLGHFVFAAKEQAFFGMLTVGPEARGAFADQTLSLRASSVGRLANENDIMRVVGSSLAPLEVLFTNDRIFSLMPLLDGDAEIVAEQLIDRPIQERFFWLSELVRQIAPELAQVHAAGHIHRDLKLPNLLVDRSGNLHLADYGLAISTICPHDFAGTPHYVAPEIYLDVRNLRRVVKRPTDRPYDGRAADLWAFGLTLMHALFGPSHPFSPRGFDDWRRQDLGLGIRAEEFLPDMHRGYRRLLLAAPVWRRFLYGETGRAPVTGLGGLDDALTFTARHSLPLARLMLALFDPNPRMRPRAEALASWLPQASSEESRRFVKNLQEILPASFASPTPATQIVILKVTG